MKAVGSMMESEGWQTAKYEVITHKHLGLCYGWVPVCSVLILEKMSSARTLGLQGYKRYMSLQQNSNPKFTDL